MLGRLVQFFLPLHDVNYIKKILASRKQSALLYTSCGYAMRHNCMSKLGMSKSHLYLSGMLIQMITAMSLAIIILLYVQVKYEVVGFLDKNRDTLSPSVLQLLRSESSLSTCRHYIQCSWRQCESAHSLAMKRNSSTHSRLSN